MPNNNYLQWFNNPMNIVFLNAALLCHTAFVVMFSLHRDPVNASTETNAIVLPLLLCSAVNSLMLYKAFTTPLKRSMYTPSTTHRDVECDKVSDIKKASRSDNSVFVIDNVRLNEFWNISKGLYWTMGELDFTRDKSNVLLLSTSERSLLKVVLFFFTWGDMLVNDNIIINFKYERKEVGIRAVYAIQEVMECIHGETYIETIRCVFGERSVDEAKEVVQNTGFMKAKADWIEGYMDGSLPYANRLIAFACVEGIFFSGSFCVIYWFKKKGLLPGICQANSLIARDEALHTNFAVFLYEAEVKSKSSIDVLAVLSIVKTAVLIEKEYMSKIIPHDIETINVNSMSTYIEFIADRLLVDMGFSKIYNVENPFDFMIGISTDSKSNMFETKVTEYKQAGIGINPKDNVFRLDADF